MSRQGVQSDSPNGDVLRSGAAFAITRPTMASPQDPRTRRKQKAKATKNLAKWREEQATKKAPAKKAK